MKTTLGLGIIVGPNDAKVLDRCLKSVVGSVFDDIAIVPTAYVWDIEEVARQYTRNIKQFEWRNDFSAARNFSFSLLTTDFVMWLDADDVLPEESYKKLFHLKPQLTKGECIWMPYIYSPTSEFPRERIIHREEGHWVDKVHEYISSLPHVTRRYTDIKVEHRSEAIGNLDRNIKILREIYNSGHATERNIFYLGRDLLISNGKELQDEGEQVLIQYVEKGKGWDEELAAACLFLARHRQKLGDWAGAVAFVEKGMVFNENFAEMYVLMGDSYFEKQDYVNAILWYKKAMELRNLPQSPHNPAFNQFIPADKLSVALYEMGQYKEALSYNAQALKFAPEDTRLLRNKQWMQSKA
jgi:glycosyltransferase involved in cell wall biosynthesis